MGRITTKIKTPIKAPLSTSLSTPLKTKSTLQWRGLFSLALFVIIGCFVAPKSRAAKLEPETLQVCPNCAISTLTQAVNQSVSAGTIILQAGLYQEKAPVLIEKPLTILGMPGAIVDGEEKYQIFTIRKTQDVNIENLQIQNSGASYTEDLAGIKVIESKNCHIRNNRFINTTYGVYLEKSEAALVQNNYIEGKAVEEIKSGNGVHLWTGSENIIDGNTIVGHRDGVYLEFAKGGLVKNNSISKNLRYGLHFMQSNDTTYEKNIFSQNGAGVAVMYSRKIKMVDNQFINNSGASSYGLLLKEISDSLILRNDFVDNTMGIYMEGSNRSHFKHNNIKNNGWGLKIMGDCEGNEFYLNNFIGNTFEVSTNSDHSWNNFSKNYWSQYDGYDLDGDGIGDKPHRPISLSSLILERVDSAYILLNSFFFRLIDEVERALPEMINGELADASPLIKEVDRKHDKSR